MTKTLNFGWAGICNEKLSPLKSSEPLSNELARSSKMFICCITTTTRSMVPNQILGVPWPKKFWMSWRMTKSEFPGNILGKVQFEKKFGGVA